VSSHKHYHPNNDLVDKADVGALIAKLLTYKRSIVLTALFIFFLGVFYVSNATKYYEATGDILFTKDIKQKSASDFLAVTPTLGTKDVNIDDELSLFQTPEFIQSVVERLTMNIRVYHLRYKEGDYVRKSDMTELYKDIPFNLMLKKNDRITRFSDNVYFMLSVIDEKQFRLSVEVSFFQHIKRKIKESLALLSSDEQAFYEYTALLNFDEDFVTPWLSGKVMKKQNNIHDHYLISYGAEEDGINLIKQNLKVERANKTGNIIVIKMQDEIAERAPIIVNAVMSSYLESGLKQETQSDNNVIRFIDEQLQTMQADLEKESRSIEHFKAQNKFLDLSAKTQLKVVTISELEKKKYDLEIEEAIIANMLSDLLSGSLTQAPTISSQTTTNPSITANITKLQELNAARSSMLIDYTPEHPDLIKVEENIKSLKRTLEQSLRSAIQENRKKRQTLASTILTHERELSVAPSQEKVLSDLNRNYLVRTKVFDFLLQRRAEVGISKSAKEPKGRIINQAVQPKTASKPNKPVVLIIALFAGLFLGVLQAFIRVIRDDRIYTLQDVRLHSHMPIYGLLPVFSEKKTLYNDAMRSLLFRISQELKDKPKVISITGSVPGEGRLTTVVELCRIIGESGKRAVAVDFDIRAERSVSSSRFGIVSYLAGKNRLEDIIYKAQHGVSVIPIGDISHEGFTLGVLSSDKLTDLFSRLSQEYDYVVVQAPYLGLLSDAVVLAHVASLNLVVLRSGRSRIAYIKSANRLVDDYQLNNTAFILNALPLDAIRPWVEHRSFNVFSRLKSRFTRKSS